MSRTHLKRIARYFKPYGALVAATLGVVAVSALLGLIPPLLLRTLIDDALPHGNLALVNWLALGMILAPLAAGLLGVLETFLDEKISQGIMLDLRLSLFARLQQQTMAYFTATRPGEITSRLNNDVNDLQDVFSDTVVAISNNLFIVVSTLVVVFTLNWRLALLAIAILPLFILPARWVGRIRQGIVTQSQEKKADLTAYVQDAMSINGFLMRRVFGNRERERSKYATLSRDLRDIQIRRSLVWRWFTLTLGLFSALGPAIIYWYGAHLIVQGALTVGTIVAFVAYLGRLYGPVSALANVHVEVMSAIAVFERLFGVLDLVPSIQDRPGARAISTSEGHLSFEHVGFHYRPDRSLLQDVSFEARPGELVALVGPSGAGKSTISYLIPRFYDPTEGRVLLDGTDLRDLTLESLEAQIGVVTQEPFLFHTTIKENLRYAKPEATDDEIVAACRSANIHEMIASLPEGYDTTVGERGYRLSGGEKQRLALARVILKSPRILILDEATSALDSHSEALIQAALTPLMEGRTTVAIAHRLSTILHADQILVVERGRIVEQGRHAELLARGGLYAKLYREQFAEKKLEA
ncbi:ABC transporter ATP-binding protein [bacterium]|nr:ABC transporter ATP-binding protein [bacterium]